MIPPGTPLHLRVWCAAQSGDGSTNNISVRLIEFSDDSGSMVGTKYTTFVLPTSPGWVDVDMTSSTTSKRMYKLGSFNEIPVGSTVMIGPVMLCTQKDWQAMQALGVNWFDGGSYPGHWVFDEHVISGSVNLLTSGSGNSPVTIRFNGDVTNPQVLHVQSGKILAYSGRIGAGHYVLFDGQSRQVLIDGATPARGAATRLEWFTAQQGANTFQYSAERGEDTSTMTVSFREGWL